MVKWFGGVKTMKNNLNLRNDQKSSTSIESCGRNYINAPPNVYEVIANISQELTLLNYKNYPLRTKERFKKRCVVYFRSHNDKRIIGAFVTLLTFKNKWVTQKEVIDRFPHMKKAFVSLVFKHCILEGWFISKRISPKISCYKVCDMMLEFAKEYYTFCRNSRNEFEFIY